MADQDGDRSQQPTQRRRQQAREQGNVVKSQDLASAIAFLGALGGLYYFGGQAMKEIWLLTQSSLGNELPLDGSIDAVVGTWHETLGGLALSVGPLLAIFGGVALVANVAQTGWLFLPGKASIDVTRVSPWQGVGRVFSIANGAKLGLSLLKIVVIGTIVYFHVRSNFDVLFGLVGTDVFAIAALVTRMFFELGLHIGIGLLVVAALDYGFQYWKHEQELRMTPQQVLEELRSVEPDPQIRSRRSKLHRATTMSPNELEGVDALMTGDAGVIALRYDEVTMTAPKIVAIAIGASSRRMRVLAASQQVSLVSAPTLTEDELDRMQVGDELPSRLYEVAAGAYHVSRS